VAIRFLAFLVAIRFLAFLVAIRFLVLLHGQAMGGWLPD
jgi:hypothetical protein